MGRSRAGFWRRILTEQEMSLKTTSTHLLNATELRQDRALSNNLATTTSVESGEEESSLNLAVRLSRSRAIRQETLCSGRPIKL